MANAPIVILGNKIDLPGAVSEQELRYVLGISTATTGKVSDEFHLEIRSTRICPSGHRSTREYQRSADGIVHVQCLATRRLWRSISMVVSVFVTARFRLLFVVLR